MAEIEEVRDFIKSNKMNIFPQKKLLNTSKTLLDLFDSTTLLIFQIVFESKGGDFLKYFHFILR